MFQFKDKKVLKEKYLAHMRDVEYTDLIPLLFYRG
jgi:hypothetical protein